MNTTYKYDSDKLVFVKTNVGRTARLFKLSTLLLSALFLLSVGYKDDTPKQMSQDDIEREIILLTDREDNFSSTKLRDLLIDLNIKYPDIVYAQTIQETGGHTSNIFIENHNLFGMKVATQRPTTNKGVNRNHAYYSSWQNSVIDYALYQSKYLSQLTRTQYIDYLSRNYAEDTEYVDRLLAIVESNENCKYLREKS